MLSHSSNLSRKTVEKLGKLIGELDKQTNNTMNLPLICYEKRLQCLNVNKYIDAAGAVRRIKGANAPYVYLLGFPSVRSDLDLV